MIKIHFPLECLERNHLLMWVKLADRFAADNGRPWRAIKKAMARELWRRETAAARATAGQAPLDPVLFQIPDMEPRFLLNFSWQLHKLNVFLDMTADEISVSARDLVPAQELRTAIETAIDQRMADLDPAAARFLRPGKPSASQRPN